MPKKNERKAQAEALPDQEQPLHEEKEPPQGKEAVILHPGSSTLYLGFASDSTPQAIPHILAYKTTALVAADKPPEESRGSDAESRDVAVSCEQGTQSCGSRRVKEDPSLVLEYEVNITPELEGQREEGLQAIRRALADYRASMGKLNCEVDRKNYNEHNSRVEPKAKMSDELSLTDLSGNPKLVIGNEVLYLPPNAGYKVCKPIKSGRLNVSSSQPLSVVRSQLEDLWTRAIEEYLDLPRKEFKHYQVVLLVSDIIDRQTLKEMVNVLFRMEFAAAILHQESVCATYCAGLSSACVVNVGDEVSHVCCVEDGMSNPNTRVVLNYGGSDITRLFYWLIKQTNFPYQQCRPDNCLDGVLLQQLKESVCHMDATQSGVHDYQFSVMSKTPGYLLDYEIKLLDEALLAPMGVFFPSSFCLPDNCELMAGQPALVPPPDDLYDEGHWMEGQTVTTRPSQPPLPTVGFSEVAPDAARRLKCVPLGKILSLDQAIHFSIDCASSQDMKKKLYGSILLVGGGLAYPGAAAMLQSRLEVRAPSGNTAAVEVFSNPRDLESTSVCWKGGAILRCLDTTQELWIERQEWEFYGVRILRERVPFQW